MNETETDPPPQTEPEAALPAATSTEPDAGPPLQPGACPAPLAWAQLSNWQEEYQWIQEERKRLEAYTLSQFALLKQQREELLGRRSGIEETLALREQELNRQMKLLAEGTAAQEKRDCELAERETALTAQMEKLANARQEFQTLQQVNAQLQSENETQFLLAQELRLQSTHLQETVRAARSELSVLEQALQRDKNAAEEERAEITASRRQLEERHAAMEKTEGSLRRRVAEIDQLEAQIRHELEQRERQIALDYQELERARAKLRLQVQKHSGAPNGAARGETPSLHADVTSSRH
jgi:DNA repair exonuclease SbcCD ATPase subunit